MTNSNFYGNVIYNLSTYGIVVDDSSSMYNNISYNTIYNNYESIQTYANYTTITYNTVINSSWNCIRSSTASREWMRSCNLLNPSGVNVTSLIV